MTLGCGGSDLRCIAEESISHSAEVRLTASLAYSPGAGDRQAVRKGSARRREQPIDGEAVDVFQVGEGATMPSR